MASSWKDTFRGAVRIRTMWLRAGTRIAGCSILWGFAFWIESSLSRVARLAASASEIAQQDFARAAESVGWNLTSVLTNLLILTLPFYVALQVGAASIGTWRRIAVANPVRARRIRVAVATCVAISLAVVSAFAAMAFMRSRAEVLEIETLARQKHGDAAPLVIASIAKLEPYPYLHALALDGLRYDKNGARILHYIATAYAPISVVDAEIESRAARFKVGRGASPTECLGNTWEWENTVSQLDRIEIPQTRPTISLDDQALIAISNRLRDLAPANGGAYSCEIGYAAMRTLIEAEFGSDYYRAYSVRDVKSAMQAKKALCDALEYPAAECDASDYAFK